MSSNIEEEIEKISKLGHELVSEIKEIKNKIHKKEIKRKELLIKVFNDANAFVTLRKDDEEQSKEVEEKQHFDYKQHSNKIKNISETIVKLKADFNSARSDLHFFMSQFDARKALPVDLEEDIYKLEIENFLAEGYDFSFFKTVEQSSSPTDSLETVLKSTLESMNI